MHFRLLLRSVLAVGICSAAATTSNVSAQSNRAVADALFEEGIALRNKGDHKGACNRFKKSQSLDPARGTLYNIGLCLERQGLLASSSGTYQLLLDQAEAASDSERIRDARNKLQLLGPRIPKLLLQLEEGASLPGLEVTRNNEVINPALLGFAAPIDPGTYTISARAPSYRTWSVKITIAEKDNKKISIPVLSKDSDDATELPSQQLRKTVNSPSNGDINLSKHPEFDSSRSTNSPSKRARATVSFGPSVLSLGPDTTTRASFAIEGAWRVVQGSSAVDVGIFLGATSLPWSVRDRSGTTNLVNLLLSATYVHQLTSKVGLRAFGSAGLLALLGLDDDNHPLLDMNYTAQGNISLFNIRLGLGAEYFINDNISIVLDPLVYWFAPSADGIAEEISSFSSYQAFLGASYHL